MAQVLTLHPLFERLPAKEKKFNEAVVFVHHYGGHRHSFKRHMDWVNDLGYDVITFDLPIRQISELLHHFPVNKEWALGLRHVWADKIEEVLGGLAERKYVFSFSYSSMAALMALERRHCIDICGWICDGGPFLEAASGIENLIHIQNRFFKSAFLRKSVAQTLSYLLGEWNYRRDATRALQSLPKGFPVLSLRSEKDELITPIMIDEFFAPAFGHIDLHRVTLHNSHHLTGFREDPDTYQSALKNFLKAPYG